MNETNKESFLERSLLVGENSEIYLHRALTVLRNEGLNPYVTYEIQAKDDGILCGINQIVDILEHVLPESDREVWSLSDSNEIAKKEGLESVLLTFYPHPRHVLFDDNQDF